MGDDLQSKAAEIMKKVLTLGVGAFFLTEESLRTLASEFKLPKEILNAVLESAKKTQAEFLKTLSKELMTQIAERVDPLALLQSVLEQNEIELKVKVNFKSKKKGFARSSESSSGGSGGFGNSGPDSD